MQGSFSALLISILCWLVHSFHNFPRPQLTSNATTDLINIGKAGRKRHMGIRPTVRGSVMNPNDHPHGGGEGKCGIGRPGPSTPWGKPALGLKTRKQKKASNKLIVRRRDGKAIK